MPPQTGKRAQRKAANQEANSGGSMFAEKKFWYTIVALVLLSAGGIMQFVMLLSNFASQPAGISTLDTTQTETLKRIFFSGEPHVVYCQDEKTLAQPLPPILKQISDILQQDKSGTTVWHGNCFEKLASGRTIAERFDFGKNANFLAIFANENKPQMLNYLSNAEAVVKQIRPMVKLGIDKIVYLKDWEPIKKRKTVLLLGGKKQPQLKKSAAAFRPHLKTYRSVKIVSLDTAFWTLNLDADFEKTEVVDPDHGSAMCLIKKTEGEEDKLKADADETKGAPEKKKSKYVAQYFSGAWEGDAAQAFLELCAEGGDESFFQLARKPRLQARPSEPKVVQAPPRGGSVSSVVDEVGDGTKKGKEHVGRRPEGMDDEGGSGEDEEEEDFATTEEIEEDLEL